MENDKLINIYGYENMISIAPIYWDNEFKFSLKVEEKRIDETNNALVIVDPEEVN